MKKREGKKDTERDNHAERDGYGDDDGDAGNNDQKLHNRRHGILVNNQQKVFKSEKHI